VVVRLEPAGGWFNTNKRLVVARRASVVIAEYRKVEHADLETGQTMLNPTKDKRDLATIGQHHHPLRRIAKHHHIRVFAVWQPHDLVPIRTRVRHLDGDHGFVVRADKLALLRVRGYGVWELVSFRI